MKDFMKPTLIGAFAMTALAALAQSNIPVKVNGTTIQFQGQGPVMSGGRVLVPLRGVLEQMGANVDWSPSTQTVTATKRGTNVQLGIGQNTASVNGQPVTLDVPAQIINGSTMVPLRFLGEALGEDVEWNSQQQMVMINTGSYDLPGTDANQLRDNNPNWKNRDAKDHERPLVIDSTVLFSAGTVIPVVLSDSLNSANNVRGDRFMTTVRNDSGLPTGTKVEGVVEGARQQSGTEPGMLELRFTQIDMPDGKTYPISGSLINLDKNSVAKNGNRLVATSTAPDRAAYTGYGAGAGLVVGLLTKRPIEDAVIGGLLGLGASFIPQTNRAHNVNLEPGTSFGVRLRNDVSIRQGDLQD